MSLSDKAIQQSGYSMSELRLILHQEKASLRKEIESLSKEINEKSRGLERAAERLAELERAENLLD